jgi:hypothetical protein
MSKEEKLALHRAYAEWVLSGSQSFQLSRTPPFYSPFYPRLFHFSFNFFLISSFMTILI